MRCVGQGKVYFVVVLSQIVFRATRRKLVGVQAWISPTITCPVNNNSSQLQLKHFHLVGQSDTRLSFCLHCFSMDPDTCVTGPNVPCISVWTDLAMLGRELRGRGVVKGTTLNSAGHILSPHALNSTADSFLSWIQSAARRQLIMDSQPYSDALASTNIYQPKTKT